MKKDTSQDIYLYIIGWVGIGLIIIYLFLKYALHVALIDFAGPCVLNMLTGFYCPGCGGTRAVFALAKGDILKSFVYHPFVPYAAVLGGWFMISQTIERISHGKIKIALHFRMIYVWVGLALIALNAIWKNGVLLLNGNPPF